MKSKIKKEVINMNKVMELVKELETEEKNVKIVPHFYKRKGKMVERSYPDRIYSNRYHELINEIEEKKVFKCSECGEMVSYFGLETWCCNFKEGNYICSCCYEEEMGEDL